MSKKHVLGAHSYQCKGGRKYLTLWYPKATSSWGDGWEELPRKVPQALVMTEMEFKGGKDKGSYSRQISMNKDLTVKQLDGYKRTARHSLVKGHGGNWEELFEGLFALLWGHCLL